MNGQKMCNLTYQSNCPYQLDIKYCCNNRGLKMTGEELMKELIRIVMDFNEEEGTVKTVRKIINLLADKGYGKMVERISWDSKIRYLNGRGVYTTTDLDLQVKSSLMTFQRIERIKDE
jgi:hypothetical protein